MVAFPTELGLRLGGNAKSDEAVEKIFAPKGRPSDNPLIIHIAQGSQLEEFVEEVPDQALTLMNHFWPGPLTIIFNYKKGTLSGKQGRPTNKWLSECQNHPVAIAIIKKVGLPIAAPSANRSGRPSPTSLCM